LILSEEDFAGGAKDLREEAVGGFEKLHNEKFHTLRSCTENY
jgi:hypothetical protein